MDKNSSMERRFSLNASSMRNPIAESTCLNGTSSASASPHFQWGGTPISPKNRSNSSFGLSSSGATSTAEAAAPSFYNRSRTNANSPLRSNKSKIDPRIYADVQSKGLASRIVKYHENGTRLNRSMSMNNLYNKPGQFPVVHLKKTELPYKATNKQNLSMTRIAPPERSMFYGNTLSSLLRSNSIVGLHKTDEEISRENRPILHPPPTESEMAPTRSVLDVLKEISRKRINNDDLVDSNDMTKKYCNREASNDFLDNAVPPSATQTSYQYKHLHQQQQSPLAPQHLMRHQLNLGHNHCNNSNSSQSFKRQREQHQQLPTQQQTPTSQHTQKHIPVSTSAGRPQPAIGTQQYSPEQIAKKRLCSYNNDITSSLSSSVYHANKRKLYADRQATTEANTSSGNEQSSYLEDYNNAQQQRTKMMRQQQPSTTITLQSELRLKQLQQTLSCNTPITPIPATPLSQSVDAPSSAIESGEAHRTRSEPIYPVVGAAAVVKKVATLPPPLPLKPKLTLFNAKYGDADDTVSSTDDNAIVDDNALEAAESAGINFVKPKKSSSISNARNPLIERTQKCKLAQMLCGLRGEIYHGGYDEAERDQLDAPTMSKQNTVATAPTNSSNLAFMTTAISAATSLPIQQPSPIIKPTTTITTTNPTNDEKSPSSASIIGINSLKKDGAAAPLASFTAAPAAIPTLVGLKFKPTTVATTPPVDTPTTTSVTTAIVTPTKSTGSPLVGLKLTPQTATVGITTAVSSNAASVMTATPTFSFGTPSPATGAAATITKTASTIPSAVPMLGGFPFTAVAKPTTAPLPANRFAPSAPGMMLFGATSTPTTATAAPVIAPVFGTLNQTAAAPPAPATFTFGGISTTPAATTATPTFGSVTLNATTTATPTPPPSFSVATAGSATAAAPKAFTFGTSASATASDVKAADVTNMFGSGSAIVGVSTTTTTTTNPTGITNQSLFVAAATNTLTTPAVGGFSFGTTTPAPKLSATAAPFSFGTPAAQTTAAAPANSAFAFGGATVDVTPAVTSSTSNNFSFGSAITAIPAATTPLNQAAPATTTTNSGNQNAFSFGGSAAVTTAAASANQAAPLFGNAANNSPSTFSFGGSTATGASVVAPQQTSVFGNAATAAPAATFTFGSAQTTDKPSTTAGSAGGFAFGGAAVPTTTTTAATLSQPSTNLFGTPSNAATTNVVKPSFSFGGGGPTVNAASDTGKNLFGGAVVSAASNNTFGSLAAATNSTQNKTFAFGGTGNNNVTSPTLQSNNLFGAATAPASNKSLMGGFSFGNAAATTATAANSSNMQQQQQLNKPTATTVPTPTGGAFSFGGVSTNANNNSTAAPFAFGTQATQPTASKTFAFGGTNTQQQQQQQPATPAPSAAFSFSGQTPAASAGVAANGNMFAPPPHNMGSGPSGDRPIRRATRRLQKS